MLEGRERALATVDLAAVRYNIRRLIAALPPTGALCAVVKANGYGHGAVPVARAALDAGRRLPRRRHRGRGRGAARGGDRRSRCSSSGR